MSCLRGGRSRLQSLGPSRRHGGLEAGVDWVSDRASRES
jgi:hypothetical protein